MTFIYAVILFCILIFPHELGHFIVAKAVGVKVNEFAMGMGPALYKKQKGETLYAIRLIPIGGYCAMEGENEESEDNRAFNNKPVWAKISVLAAGSIMNIVIAILVLSIILGVTGNATTTIAKVEKNSPAYEAGIMKGDKILSINGSRIEDWNDITGLISLNDKDVNINLKRGNKDISITAFPKKSEDGRYIIGIIPEVKHNPIIAVENGVKATWSMTKTMFVALKQLITGQVSATELAGPVGMISLVSDTNKYGLWYLGYLTALISINLAIVNMLPFPALDGGRIVFVFIRKVTGKMISDDLEGKIHMAGIILLFGLMIFATWNDITRLVG